MMVFNMTKKYIVKCKTNLLKLKIFNIYILSIKKLSKNKIKFILITTIFTSASSVYFSHYMRIYQDPDVRKELSVKSIFID